MNNIVTNNFAWPLLKKPIAYRFIILLSLLCLPITSTAQTGEALNLNEALSKTMASNPELRPYYFQLEAATARIEQADTAPRPELSLVIEDALGSGELKGTDSAQTTLSITWAFEGSLRDKRVDFAKSSHTITESERDIQLANSIAQTANYFLQALALQERVAVAEQSVDMMTTTLEALRKRSALGRATNADVLSTEADLSRLQLTVAEFNQQLHITYQQLAAQWGERQAAFNRVTGTLTDIPPLDDWQTVQQRLQNNPQLTRLVSLENMVEAERRLVQQQRKREGWRFSAGVRRVEVSGDYGFVGGFSLPIGGGSYYQGRQSEIQARAQAYGAERDALRLRLESHLFRLYQQLQLTINQSSTLNDSIIPKLQQAQTEVRQGYERGRHSYLELLSVQNKLIDAQFDVITASLDAHLNAIEIERLTGGQLSNGR